MTNDSQSQTREFIEGLRAAIEGRGWIMCPYMPSSDWLKHNEWMRGFESARYGYKPEQAHD